TINGSEKRSLACTSKSYRNGTRTPSAKRPLRIASGIRGSQASPAITRILEPRLPNGGRMSLERSNNWYNGPPRTKEKSSLWANPEVAAMLLNRGRQGVSRRQVNG